MKLPVRALLVAAVMLAACGSDEPAPSPPAPSSPGPTTGALPTGPPLGTVTLTSGSADVSITGGVEATASFEGVSTPAIYQPLPGTVAVTWSSGGLAIVGSLNLGAQATIAGLSISMAVPVDGSSVALTSAAGECTITIDAADDRSFSGSFDCRDLTTADGLTVSATGTFEASG